MLNVTCSGTITVTVCSLFIGVPPSDARQFYVSMLERDLELSHLEYSLLALGDSNYPQFCKTGRLLDSR